MPSQKGRRILITGANSGIGFHAALKLARKGAEVILACRDRQKGEIALDRLHTEAPRPTQSWRFSTLLRWIRCESSPRRSSVRIGRCMC